MSLNILGNSHGRYRGLSSECFILCDFPIHIVTFIVGSAAHSPAMEMPRVVAILIIRCGISVPHWFYLHSEVYSTPYLPTTSTPCLRTCLVTLSNSYSVVLPRAPHAECPNDPRVSRDCMSRSFSFPLFVFHLRSPASLTLLLSLYNYWDSCCLSLLGFLCYTTPMYQPDPGDNDESAEVGCGVFNRRVYFCAKQQAFDTADLIEQCYKCDRFYLMCCAHVFNQVDVCHSTRLIFTDGACLSNGHRNAQAGIGVAVGMCEKDQMAAPIDDRMDGVGKRTNQRAELLAALEGLKMMSRITPIDDDEAQSLRDQAYRGDPNAWVITTDSEYVVKGMTEWLPKWKVRHTPSDRNLWFHIIFPLC